MLSKLPNICPLIWNHSSGQSIALGAAFHYGKSNLAVATLEHVSFSTKGEIDKQTVKVANMRVTSDGSLRVALESFETISELRHSVVHSYDELFYKNMKELKISCSSTDRYSVTISPILFQSFVAVCHSFVRAYNRFLLDCILSAWNEHSLLSMDWGREKSRFKPLFDTFKSQRDGVGPASAYHAFRQVVKALNLHGLAPADL